MTRLRLRLLLCFALCASALGLVSARADSPNPSFYLVNRSTQAITEVYASPVSSDGWGRNRLTDEKINPDGSASIRLLADGTCRFDLRVVYQDGNDEQRRAVNTCIVDNIEFGAPARPAPPRPAPPRPAPPTDQPAPQSDNPARDPSFRIVNRGDREIDEVYARVAGSTNWGRDRLGDGTINPNSFRVVNLPRGQCLWDIRLVFADGPSTERRRLNLCDVTDLPVP